ncbi:MAG: DUF72 domain-containing protein [Bacteroidota bacterium]
MPARTSTTSTLPLFGEESGGPSSYAARNRERIRRWAGRGVLFGSSSWKYPGWKGSIYTRSYPSREAFNAGCLAEYAEIFPTVCADFALYDFPDASAMRAIRAQSPDHFRLSLKVTDRITVERYPRIPRYGPRGGTENPDFLNVELFEDAFLKPLEELGTKRGAVIFEFAAFPPRGGMTAEKFTALLDGFLARLPRGYAYAVEIRNGEFLTPGYLAMLQAHGAAHVLSSWTRMPPLTEQLQVEGVLRGPFSVARALLRPGRKYEEAVELFRPYSVIREENPGLRMGLAEAARRSAAEGRTLYAYVNNRAEGNAPLTIQAVLDILEGETPR